MIFSHTSYVVIDSSKEGSFAIPLNASIENPKQISFIFWDLRRVLRFLDIYDSFFFILSDSILLSLSLSLSLSEKNETDEEKFELDSGRRSSIS